MIKVFVRRSIILFFGSLFAILSFWGNQVFAETKNAHEEITFKIVLAEKNCQIAIWLVNEQGEFVDTVYVTRKIAQKGLGNRGGGLDDKLGGSRLSVFPVWAHQRGVDYGGGNFYPPKDKALVDAITSATPKSGEFIWIWLPQKSLKPGKYYYYIEVNKSFDDNEHNNYSWYRGQPSVIWQGNLFVGQQLSESKAKIIGHGDAAGKDGKIYPDLSSLTTALRLIEKAEVIYTPGKN
ncbi:MAG: hypothetical protein MUP22_04585 [Desulfobacterales bacterium]|nr:hypothetical protein [Desulfobacterales bacterium]